MLPIPGTERASNTLSLNKQRDLFSIDPFVYLRGCLNSPFLTPSPLSIEYHRMMRQPAT